MLGLEGRSGRVIYGMIALPVLLERHYNYVIVRQIETLFGHMTQSLAQFSTWLLFAFLLLQLLTVPLVIVTVRRLHDIGLTGYLALPYLLTMLIGFYFSFTKIAMVIPNDTIHVAMAWLRGAAYYCGLALAVALLFIPGRKRSAGRTAALAF